MVLEIARATEGDVEVIATMLGKLRSITERRTPRRMLSRFASSTEMVMWSSRTSSVIWLMEKTGRAACREPHPRSQPR